MIVVFSSLLSRAPTATNLLLFSRFNLSVELLFLWFCSASRFHEFITAIWNVIFFFWVSSKENQAEWLLFLTLVVSASLHYSPSPYFLVPVLVLLLRLTLVSHPWVGRISYRQTQPMWYHRVPLKERQIQSCSLYDILCIALFLQVIICCLFAWKLSVEVVIPKL